MKITRDQLHNSDWSTLFTRDPATFFEAIIITLLWDKSKERQNLDYEEIERQKFVFARWHKYFEANLRHEIEQELGLVKTKATADYQNGHLAGQIYALTNLPIKSGALGKSVDLKAVTELLRQLKAKEPIGVTTDGAKVS